jgi:hypothetical protein
MKKIYKTLRTSRTVLMVLLTGILMIAAQAIYGQATRKTDKLDYAPGETVLITGTNWQKGESVSLMVMNLTYSELNLLPHYGEWFVTADSLGNFSSWWDVTEDELGTELVLTALGQSSGYKEQVFFTDAPDINDGDGTMIVDISSVCAELVNQSFTFTFTNNQNNEDFKKDGLIRLTIPSGGLLLLLQLFPHPTEHYLLMDKRLLFH